MRYTGIQPQYFPRLHYIARLLNTDIFLIRDDVQFVGRHDYPDGKRGPSYQAHTPIATASGRYLLNVPIQHGGFQLLYKTPISYQHAWVRSHIETIKLNYKKAAYASSIIPQVETLLNNKYPSIAELNIASLLWALSIILDIESFAVGSFDTDAFTGLLKQQAHGFRLKRIERGINIPVLTHEGTSMSASEKILAACKALGVTEDYCGGTAVAAYFDQELMNKNGISVKVQNWTCSAYSQTYDRKIGFLPNLSIIDVLMNVSPAEARTILSSRE